MQITTKIDPSTDEGYRDITEGVIPLKQEYGREFSLGYGVDTKSEDRVVDHILSLLGQNYGFFVTKVIQDQREYYAGYAIGLIQNRAIYQNMETYVSPGYRRRGIGNDLLRLQIDTARQVGCTHLNTQAIDENDTAAVNFCREMGFSLKQHYRGIYSGSLKL